MNFPLERDVIEALIPHRDPFLLIDRVVDVVPSVSASSVKNLLEDDWYFKGHFPSHHVFPGVLIIESLAQTASVCAAVSLFPDFMNKPSDFMNKPVYLVTIEQARFKRPVFPGNVLCNFVEVQKVVRGVWFFNCTAKVNDLVVADCVIRALLP